MRLLFTIALVLAGLLGCATSGPVDPPAQLSPIQPTIVLGRLWTTALFSSDNKSFTVMRPALVADVLYLGDSKGHLNAFDANTGKHLWSQSTKLPFTGGIAVNDNMLLVGTRDAEVLAYQTADGTLLWRTKVSSVVLSAPQRAGDIVVVHTTDGKLFGLDAKTGNSLWVNENTVPGLTLHGASTPLVVNQRVIVGLANGKLLAIDVENGKSVWEATVAVARGRSELERIADVDADPVIKDNVIYTVSFQGRIAAVELENGRILWARDMSSSAGLSADDKAVYVTDDQGHLWALDRNNGTALWKQEKLRGRGLTAPVLFNDYVVVGDFEGYLHWLARDSGAFAARYKVDESALTAKPISNGANVYAMSLGGVVEALYLK